MVVTGNGKPVAVLLSVVDEEEIERLVLAYSPKFQGLLDVARREIQEGKGLSINRVCESPWQSTPHPVHS